MKKILVVVGTRPNFIKVTQFKKAAQLYSNIEVKLVHTGQHFDAKMADVFFQQFQLTPDFFLNISTTVSANKQVAEMMIKLEDLITNDYHPDVLVVVGDVNSTLAAALTANKLSIPLAHVESGLRSHDRSMPEEHNRVLTDKLSDYFFVTEQSGYDNLITEGVDTSRIAFVGNTMIDTMVAFEKEIDASPILDDLKLTTKSYVLMTMHRPATVDNVDGLKKLIDLLKEITKTHSVAFPVHPRTLKNIESLGLKNELDAIANLTCIEPLDYFAFQKLVKHSAFILTDSGGIQEESTYLKIPCLTLRPNTERPITCTLGTNTLVPFEVDKIMEYVQQITNKTYKTGEIPPMWDGKATERIFYYLNDVIVK